MNEEEKNEKSNFPSQVDIIFSVPLYKKIPIENCGNVNHFFVYGFKCRAFCPMCENDSIFECKGIKWPPGYNILTGVFISEVFSKELICAADTSHILRFYFIVEDEFLIKVGQHPSAADLLQGELNKYKKLLGDKYKELARGVGLHSFGVNIGSFCYLRRVFESLIEEARVQAVTDGNLDEDKYIASRISEKIILLKDYLPDFLVSNSQIYSILSKGVHELSEDECGKFFHAMLSGIELILDQHLEEKKRQEKEAAARKAIQGVNEAIKNNV